MIFEQEKNMTIVAPMTPAGVSAIAALRVSGSFAKRIAETLFEQKNITPRKACYGILKHPNTKKILTLYSISFLTVLLHLLEKIH
jgi:tRNA modification GTPase